MKAATYYKYGNPEVLMIEDIPIPETKTNEILVKVIASTINSGDWRLRKAEPFMVRLFFGVFKPKIRVLGTAFSGIIEEIGENVGCVN